MLQTIAMYASATVFDDSVLNSNASGHLVQSIMNVKMYQYPRLD